jgi:hypothetical protein
MAQVMNANGPQPDPRATTNKRRTGRLVCEELVSNFGPVVDLSSEGCRVIQGRLGGAPVGARVRLRLEGYDTCVTVAAQVMRRRGRGPLKTEIGIRFLDLSPEQKDAVTALARTHRVRYAIIRTAA